MKNTMKMLVAAMAMIAFTLNAQAQFPDAAGAADYGKEFATMTLRKLHANVGSLRQAKAAASRGDETTVREIIASLKYDLSEIEGYSDEIRSAAYWISLDRPDIDVTLLDFAGAYIEANEDYANNHLDGALLGLAIDDYAAVCTELEAALEVYEQMITLAELAKDQSILIKRSL